MDNLWRAYVIKVSGNAKQTDVAERVGVNQGTISRWMTGDKAPDSAANVAAFARAYKRNPLEAFVAAGMLEESEAGRGLTTASRRLLAGLRDGGTTAAAQRGVARGLDRGGDLATDSSQNETQTRRQA